MLTLLLCDRNHEVVAAWRREWWPDGTVIGCALFGDHVGCDAVVSPANSFGFMDGGIDQVYTDFFGPKLQETLQSRIKSSFDGELLVGQATIVETGHTKVRLCIAAPTMRVPMDINHTANIFLATRAAVRALLASGFDGEVFVPGMGTGAGRVKPSVAAYQMSRGVRDAYFASAFPATLGQASEDHLRFVIGGPLVDDA